MEIEIRILTEMAERFGAIIGVMTKNPTERDKGGTNVRLEKLKLHNFQGVRNAEFAFHGRSASIYGDNATGKTTVYNALTWLLFGQPSTGSKGFTPKTKGPDGDLHHMDHMAEAEITTESGVRIWLRKVYHENYKTKRGSSTEEFDGHSVDFFLDGVPVKEKDYTKTLQDLFGGVERMRLLTMPHYFAEALPWEERRKLLLEICGDVTDQQIIASNAELSELPDFLRMPGAPDQFYTVENYRKIAASGKTEISKQLQGIPGRIDEARRAIPDVSGADAQTTNARITALQSRIAQLTADRAAAASSSTAGTGLRNAAAEMRAAIAEEKAKHTEQQSRQNAELDRQIREKQNEADTHRRAAADARAKVELVQSRLGDLKRKQEERRKEYRAAYDETWPETNEVCPPVRTAPPSGTGGGETGGVQSEPL